MTSSAKLPAMAYLAQVGQGSTDLIERIVIAAKDHLDADISFLAEFEDGFKVIRRSAGDGATVGLEDHSRFPLADTYCHRIVSGELPNAIPDARAHPLVMDLAITRQLDIGSYVSVPIVLPSGRTFGTLCCIGHRAQPTLNERDVRFMRVLADIVRAELHREELERQQRQEKTDRIRSLIDAGGLRAVFQPIVDLNSGAIVGAEALSRFEAEPRRPPDVWFAEAAEVGLSVELELLAVRAATSQLDQFPDGVYMSFNVSSEVLLSRELTAALEGVPAHRAVIELTEQTTSDQHDSMLEAIRQAKKLGFRVAMDDVGAGHSGMLRFLRIGPDILKLDMLLTRDIHRDPVKQALVAATVGFAARVHASIVAEGIETAADAETLRVLGVRYGQGYYFAKPGPLPLRARGQT